jgi:carboxyl-terminal processing protease
VPKITRLFIGVLLVAVVALSFGVGFTVGKNNISSPGQGTETIGQAWNIIRAEYVDPARINTENMSRAAIVGMIKTLDDPYTTYFSAKEYKQFMVALQGEYSGIGAIVSIQDKKLVIVSPIPDSPAEKAGLKAGDTILEINGESATGMSLDIAVGKIKGPKGTTVKLLILHQDETEPVELEITRAAVELQSVHYEMRGDIAYIAIVQFTGRTDIELEPVIQKLKEANAKGIVLDLRGNSGGWLDIVIKVASHFITQGVIVKVKSNQGIIETDKAIAGGTTTDLPMVVLVDNFSASGSEVLAGALQDHNRALISGNVTYGKGSVDTPHELSDGSGLYITIARWLTPNDRLIEGHGIEPDVKLELTGEDAVKWAIDYLTGSQQ